MTIQEYKQLYDACRENNKFAQQALDRYVCYTTMRRSGAGDYHAEYLAKGEALCRNLEVVGNVWENPNFTKRQSIVMARRNLYDSKR